MGEPLDDLTVAAAQMKTEVERHDFISDGWVRKWRLVIESHLPTIQQNAEAAKRLRALEMAIENRMQRAKDADHLQEQVTLRGIRAYADEILREGEGL